MKITTKSTTSGKAVITGTISGRLHQSFSTVLLLGLAAAAPAAWGASHFQNLGSFGSSTAGQRPYAGLVQGNDGFLYGTTLQGGSNNAGTIFKVNGAGNAPTVLHQFNGAADGQSPLALAQGSDGLLYGSTSIGGSNNMGVIFKMNKDGSAFNVLHHFGSVGSDGQNAQAGLVQGTDGALYGTTFFGGSNDLGIIFKVATNGSGYSILHHFSLSDNDGQNPAAALVEGSDKLLYGTTQFGGSNMLGTVFKLNKNGSGFGVLRHFTGNAGDGSIPNAAVIQGNDGALYGTTYSGGNSNLGTVFKLNRDGSGYGVLHNFASVIGDGQNPFSGVLEGLDGALYGSTYGGGSNQMGAIFRISKDGSSYSLLVNFDATNNQGQNPRPVLVIGNDGAFYGTTWGGGVSGLGTVFQLFPPQTPDMLEVAMGGSGAQVTIAGMSGFQYKVMRSTDLVHWTPVGNFTMSAAGVQQFVDSSAPAVAANYRAAWLP